MKIIRKIGAMAFAAILMQTAGVAMAQSDIKIGFVNTERILRDAAPAKVAQQKLEREFSARDKELAALENTLREAGKKLERDRSIITPSDQRAKQREFADMEKDYQRRKREFREDLSQRRNEELSRVLEKANQAIKRLADAEKYDIIVQEAVVTSKRIDITDQIIDALAK